MNTTSGQAVTTEASVTSKNLSKVALLRIAQYPFIALFALIVPRLMGAETYGRYALFVSLYGMIASFLDLGVTEISARAVPERERHGGHRAIATYFSRMLGFKAALDLTLAGLFILGAYWISGTVPMQRFLVPLVIAVIICDVGGSGYALLFGLNRLSLCSARDPVRRAISLALVVLLYSQYGLRGAVVSVVVVEAILACLYLGWTANYLSWADLMPDWRFMAPLLSYGAMFYLSWGVSNIWQRLGNTLIVYLHTDFRQIAVFDLSNQIFLTATGFTLFLITSLAPMFTRLRLAGKEPKIADWSRRILTYNQIACALALGCWLLVGPELIPIVFGRQYAALYANVAVLLCGTFLMTVVQLGLTLAMAYAEPMRYLTALLLAVATFVTASLWLVPSHGALGCSLATLLSCAVCALAIGLRYRGILRASLAPSLKPIIVAVVLLLPCWLYRGSPERDVALLAVFLAAYGGVLFIGRIVGAQEIQQAWVALRHRES
jgi:O-antigen/teichoic acid export membrane protein